MLCATKSLGALCVVWLLMVGDVQAITVDFEGLVTGTSVNGQAGWTTVDEFGSGPTAFDEEVVDDGSGNNVWRVSNAVIQSGFSNLPFSQTSPQVAGETGSALYNDRGPNSASPLSPPNPGAFATTKNFRAGFRFRSATGAAQSGLELSISAAAKQSAWRDSFLSIVDDGTNGFDLSFYETGSEADPFGAGANFSEIASDLAYNVWHTVDMYFEFVDGTQGTTFGNDTVTVLVNGSEVFTGTTWESFYRGSNPASLTVPPQVQAVDSILFRLNSLAAGTSGNGFFFDDVVISNESLNNAPETPAVPEPTSFMLTGLGALAIAYAARRRRQGN